MTADRDDLAVVRRCAERMGWEAFDCEYEDSATETERQKQLERRGWLHKNQMFSVGEYWIDEQENFWIERCDYDPLNDDAQCFALVRKFGLTVEHFHPIAEAEWTCTGDPGYPEVHDDDLSRAICLCVARLEDSTA